jgi:hypothetical protein
MARVSSVTERISPDPAMLVDPSSWLTPPAIPYTCSMRSCAQMSPASTQRGEPSGCLGRALSTDRPGATHRIVAQW